MPGAVFFAWTQFVTAFLLLYCASAAGSVRHYLEALTWPHSFFPSSDRLDVSARLANVHAAAAPCCEPTSISVPWHPEFYRVETSGDGNGGRDHREQHRKPIWLTNRSLCHLTDWISLRSSSGRTTCIGLAMGTRISTFFPTRPMIISIPA